VNPKAGCGRGVLQFCGAGKRRLATAVVFFSVFSFQWSVFSGQFSVVSFQWSVFSFQFSVVSFQWSVVSCQWSVVSGQLSVVSGQWSVVSGQWSVVSERPLGRARLPPSRTSVFSIQFSAIAKSPPEGRKTRGRKPCFSGVGPGMLGWGAI
jgi:hypothetical protein